MDCQLEEYVWYPSFPDWLYGRLEEMGFDGLVYTRYIMSVLKQPNWVGEAFDDCCSNDGCLRKATLFECLMSSDMEKDSVKGFVDDIVGKYVQWCRQLSESRKDRRKTLSGDAHRVSFSTNYDEAFPPLFHAARDGQSVVKRSADQEAAGDVACSGIESEESSRKNGTTPKKRMKLEENVYNGFCTGSSIVAEEDEEEDGEQEQQPVLGVDQDDENDLLEEISRVALAFNNALPRSSCLLTQCQSGVGSGAGGWYGVFGLWEGSAIRGSWSTWVNVDQSCYAPRTSFDDLPIMDAKGFDGIPDHVMESVQCVLFDDDQEDMGLPVMGKKEPMESAFSALAPSKRLTVEAQPAGCSYNGASICNPLWLQKHWMQKTRRRLFVGPAEIPISAETHFVPIRSESMQGSYYPYAALERHFEDNYGSEDEGEVEGEYFVYHESSAEEEEDGADTAGGSCDGKKSLTLRFRAVKFNKFCQTDSYPSQSIAQRMIDKVKKEEGKGMARNGGIVDEETASGAVWQYQDEKDDEMLIRYVSNISLINPLDLSASCGGALS